MSDTGDYIEREEALDVISEWLMKALHPENASSYNEGERAAYRTTISEIAELPAADAIEELSKPRWIPVSERLPEAGERVLCYCRANIYEVMKMRTDGDWVYDVHHIYMHSFVTHWMPLPEPPKEG